MRTMSARGDGASRILRCPISDSTGVKDKSTDVRLRRPCKLEILSVAHRLRVLPFLVQCDGTGRRSFAIHDMPLSLSNPFSYLYLASVGCMLITFLSQVASGDTSDIGWNFGKVRFGKQQHQRHGACTIVLSDQNCD